MESPNPLPNPTSGYREGDERSAKRQRVSIACDECRVKKVKCDGIRPVCAPCAKRYGPGAACTWNATRVQAGRGSKSYVQRLEDRVRYLERGSEDSPGVSPADPNAHTTPETPINFRPVSSTKQPSAIQLPVSTPPFYQSLSGHQSTRSEPVNRQPFSSSAGRFRPGWTPNSAESPSIQLHDGSETGKRSSDHSTAKNQFRGVNAMVGAVVDEPQGQRFFGSSSVGSFIKQIKTAIDATVASPEDEQPSQSVLGKVHLSVTVPEREKEDHQVTAIDYVLPPRKTADGLLEVYWRLVHPLYPFLDREDISNAYQILWTGEGPSSEEPMFLCTLNVIFALACQLSETIKLEQREASANVFFVRARELLNFDLWHGGSIQSIQCLLLIGQYLQSTNDPHRCWIIVGLATQTAQSLGLDLPETSSQLESLRERQLVRKVWHGCVLMDRVLSMIFGRRAMVPQQSAASVPLPDVIDDEYLSIGPSAVASQPEGLPSMMAFFVKSLDLYKILHEILLAFYTPTAGGTKEDTYSFYLDQSCMREGGRSVIELDRALSKWSRALPLHLQYCSPDSKSIDMFIRQANVLRARYLHIRMLLFRPILSRFCTSRESSLGCEAMNSATDALPHRIALQCSILCVKTAQEVIQLIHSNTPSNGLSSGPLPAWWYNILFVYSAATVLVAARLRFSIVAEITEPGISSSWDHALDILKRYQHYSISAQKCVAALEILRDKVPKQSEYLQQRQGETINHERSSNAQMGYSRTETPGAAIPQPGPSDGTTTGSNGAFGNFFEDFEFLMDPHDMSWLSSVPSNL